MGAMVGIFFLRSQFTQDLLFEEDDDRKIRPMTGLIIVTVAIFMITRAVLFKPILIFN